MLSSAAYAKCNRKRQHCSLVDVIATHILRSTRTSYEIHISQIAMGPFPLMYIYFLPYDQHGFYRD